MRKHKKLGKFKKVSKKSRFKNLDNYINSIYRNNKEIIDKAFDVDDDELGMLIKNKKLKSKRDRFRELVKEYMDEGKTVDQAIKSISNSELFTEYTERAHHNLYEALKEDKDAYRLFRELTKDDKHHYTKIDLENFVYIGNNEYQYNNVIISFTNSPEEIVVRTI